MSAACIPLPMHYHNNSPLLFPPSWSCRPAPDNNNHLHLPPIKHFDLHLRPPSPPRPTLPSPVPRRVPPTAVPVRPSQNLAHWFGSETSVPVVAEKTAEMVCYLWFAVDRDPTRSSPNSRSRFHSRHSPKMDPASAALQFAPSSRFVHFMRKVLETTQVSQSVIVLSLHYIYRLRHQNTLTEAQSGSEFRVSVVALMLANKFVDDNTYTNKTWSEVAGIELDELNRMEREFLLGIDSRLYVDKSTYDSWLQLLKGLVLAKERERCHWQTVLHKSKPVRHNTSHSRYTNPTFNAAVAPRVSTHRPRSTSPVHSARDVFTFSFRLPNSDMRDFSSYDHSMSVEDPSSDLGKKRSVLAAFDEHAASRPSKRMITLQTEGLSGLGGPRSACPAFSSSVYTPNPDAFSRLSISSPSRPSTRHSSSYHSSAVPPAQTRVPQTLAMPYEMDQRNVDSHPQHLYFYSLSGSPLENRSDNRKAKLHYAPAHPLPAPIPKYSMGFHAPLVVQSANASPRDLVLRLDKSHAIPPLHLPHHLQGETTERSQETLSSSPPTHHPYVPAAHFANAGPPGVHWTATTPENRFTYNYAQRTW